VGSTHVAHHVNHTIPHYHAEEVGTRTRPVSGSTRAIAVIETTT
jgi:fatty acid desaturase